MATSSFLVIGLEKKSFFLTLNFFFSILFMDMCRFLSKPGLKQVSHWEDEIRDLNMKVLEMTATLTPH